LFGFGYSLSWLLDILLQLAIPLIIILLHCIAYAELTLIIAAPSENTTVICARNRVMFPSDYLHHINTG
jgi:hypothetical protein